MYIILTVSFLYLIRIVINPYMASKIARNKMSITSLKRAISLDSSNDKYHFLLAEFFIEKAKKNTEHARQYIELASREVKEAIRLNPWNEYYSEYSDWINEVWLKKKNMM